MKQFIPFLKESFLTSAALFVIVFILYVLAPKFWEKLFKEHKVIFGFLVWLLIIFLIWWLKQPIEMIYDPTAPPY